jgi:hypothetical protein
MNALFMNASTGETKDYPDRAISGLKTRPENPYRDRF